MIWSSRHMWYWSEELHAIHFVVENRKWKTYRPEASFYFCSACYSQVNLFAEKGETS